MPCIRSFWQLLHPLSVGALSQQLPCRLIEQVMPYALGLSGKAWLAYGLPRSRWCSSPGAGRFLNQAMVNASITMSAVMRGFSDQPTTSRLNRSSTMAR